jgi:hypothetical protein
MEGTPVYLDVEGLPDRDFYYLIGLRFRTGRRVIQHSLWAANENDENRIWKELLGILVVQIPKPSLGELRKVGLVWAIARSTLQTHHNKPLVT